LGDFGAALERELAELCEIIDYVRVLSSDMMLDEVVKEHVH